MIPSDHLMGTGSICLEPSGGPVEGTKMDRLNVWNFLAAGEDLGRLATLRVGLPLSALVRPLERAVVTLDLLIDEPNAPLFNHLLREAKQPAMELLEYVRDLWDAAHKTPTRTVTPKTVARGNELWARFEAAAQLELSALHTYSVSQTLAWDTDILVEHAEYILPEHIRTKVPAETITDLKEAGRCLAFDLYTAAAFHTIRATEAVIRAYYMKIVGVLPKVKDRNWGAYIKALKDHGADTTITGFLDHIRIEHRNPVTHPEQRLSKEQAQVLLSVCSSSIIQMAGAL